MAPHTPAGRARGLAAPPLRRGRALHDPRHAPRRGPARRPGAARRRSRPQDRRAAEGDRPPSACFREARARGPARPGRPRRGLRPRAARVDGGGRRDRRSRPCFFPRVRAGVRRGALRGEGRVLHDGERLVLRPDDAVPRLGQARRRAGHRLHPLHPGRRGPLCLPYGRGRGRRDRANRGPTTAATAAPPGSWPNSTSTPTSCSAASSGPRASGNDECGLRSADRRARGRGGAGRSQRRPRGVALRGRRLPEPRQRRRQRDLDGERALFERLGAAIAYACDVRTYVPEALDAALGGGMILIHGGGNLGDVWPRHQRLREQVLADFPGVPVVQLPQSIHFDDPAEAAAFRAAVGAHGDFVVLAREGSPSSGRRSSSIGRCSAPTSPSSSARRSSPTRLRRPCSGSAAPTRRPARAAGERGGVVVLDWIRPFEGEPAWPEEALDAFETVNALTAKIEQDPGSARELSRPLADAYDVAAAQRVARGMHILARGEVVVTTACTPTSSRCCSAGATCCSTRATARRGASTRRGRSRARSPPGPRRRTRR